MPNARTLHGLASAAVVGATALLAFTGARPVAGAETATDGVLFATMSDTPPSTPPSSPVRPASAQASQESEPAEPAQAPAAKPPKITSSTPPAPPSEAKPARASPPTVFPYRLERPITPRNAKGEKEMTFPLNLYDESADTRAEVKAACEKAAKENKRVLVIFGENYCGFCAWLHDTLVEDGRIKELLASDYVAVFADLGKPPWGKNLDLALEFGLDLNSVGAPAMSVLEAATARPIQSLPSKEVLAKPMTMQRVFDAEAIRRYLLASRVPTSSVQELIGDAQLAAAADGKRVMLCFVSSRSERSTRFRRLLTCVEIATMLERDLVVRHIDVDRVEGAVQQLGLYAGPTAEQALENLPWYIVMEPGGNLVVDSSAKGRNLGLPSTDGEIEATLAKFAKACPSLTVAEQKKLEEKFKSVRSGESE